ncbi:MAG TPA: MFS transporter [Baekduia sp.]|uniref:MFS transporter n=1 Tax=Baekduia sp. TaxID=2600305 RepID=UPI002D77678F|nr:MFS transporter [Baekduia sp.]HET6505441.1 MFS transporter [Baekduia sp.]
MPARSRPSHSPLKSRNYRLYFSGQLISVPGTWLQTVAQAWLVLQLTPSGSALGITVALQALPVLLLGPWAGAVADATDKRRMLLATQAMQAVLALVLGALTVTGVVQLWMVWVLALGLGVARAVDVPTRQSFVSELVVGDELPRAISINSTVAAAARMVGPAAGGTIIAVLGVGPCFLINGASFLGPLAGLLAMDTAKLHRPKVPPRRQPRAVREGLRYVRHQEDLLIPLLMMALVGTLAYEFQVTIPLLAHETFGLGATGFGLLYAAMGAGSVVAGLTVAGRVSPRVRTITVAAVVFGAGLALAAASPTPAVAAIFLALAGAASVVFSSSTNATIQMRAAPEMRGRVVALYIVAFMGSTPIGGPLVGAVGQAAGARAALAVGAFGCVVAVALGILAAAPRRREARVPLVPVRRRRNHARPDEPRVHA